MVGVSIAFMDFRASGFKGWVGLANFRYIFNLPTFWHSMVNTLNFTALNYLLGFPAPIILALLLNELRVRKFKKAVQTISIMPNFISWVIISGIFTALMSPVTGYLNDIIRFFGGSSVYFLSKDSWFQWIVTVVRVWAGIGYSAIIYLAALSGVDPELYEAAVLDGAGRWQQTVHITLVALKPIIMVVLVLSFAGVLNLFDPVFVFQNPMVLRSGEVLDTYIYKNGLVGGKYPVTAAVGVFKSLIGTVLVLLTNYVSKKLSDDGKSVI